MLASNDGGFYASVAILEEEKAKMKDELRTLKRREKTLEETNNTLNSILDNFKQDLKVHICHMCTRLNVYFRMLWTRKCYWWTRSIQD